jgi:hypothetical protein
MHFAPINIRIIACGGKTITIIILHGLGRWTCSGIDALPSFPGASTIPSPSRFVGEGVFRKSGVVHSFKVAEVKYFLKQTVSKKNLSIC